MLTRAVRVAERSTCDNCATYGVLDLARRSTAELRPGLRVKCRKCGHEWHME
jgi:RNase P subunit RPR2